MSDDGADLGVSAGRALDTVVGGADQPGDDERARLEEFAARIRRTPLPGDGQPIHERRDLGRDAYSFAGDALAHAFLVLEEEQPGILDKRLVYGDAPERFAEADRRWWDENMKGTEQEANAAVWEAFCERWPDGDDWIGGATGFMVGWAHNAARTINNLPPVPNPAIVTLNVPGPGEGEEDDRLPNERAEDQP